MALSAAPMGAAQAADGYVMEAPASLPGFTVYRPDVEPRGPMPIIAWANGGCANLGNRYANLLGTIARHGYLVVAIGPIGEVPVPAAPRPAEVDPAAALAERVRASQAGPAATTFRQLSQAIDWAVAANGAGALAGKVDTAHVAMMGHSCGGLQAIAAAAADPRVKTTVMLNSGIFPQPAVPVAKDALERLHGPIAYFIGGPSDMAFVNAVDDYDKIRAVPAMKAVNSFGHGGRLMEEGGGPTGGWVVRWLDWQLKGDTSAAKAFQGSDCGLCKTPGWTVDRKGFG